MNKISKKKYLVVFLLTTTVLCYNLPYLSNFFYEQFLDAYSISNGQLGTLIAMFGLTATPGYLFGGPLADKFSPKKLILLSLVLTAGLGCLMFVVSDYFLLKFIFLAFGATTTFLHWSACMKLVRAQSGQGEEGKIFGAFEMFSAGVAAVVNYGFLVALKPLSEVAGFKTVVVVYSILLLVIAVISYFVIDDISHQDDTEKFEFKMVGTVLKHPVTWINGFIVMGLFMSITGTMYLNPFLTTAFGVSSTIAVSISIFNKSLSRVFFSPIGGQMVYKFGETAKMVYITCTGVIIACLGLIFIPKNPQFSWVAIGIIFFFIIAMSAARPAISTPIPEAGIPIELTGTAMGIASAVGYSTDLWLYKLCGGWIDRYGLKGYTYIWMLFIAGMLLVIVNAFLLNRYKKKHHITKNTNV